jgi:hypothetical protein
VSGVCSVILVLLLKDLCCVIDKLQGLSRATFGKSFESLIVLAIAPDENASISSTSRTRVAESFDMVMPAIPHCASNRWFQSAGRLANLSRAKMIRLHRIPTEQLLSPLWSRYGCGFVPSGDHVTCRNHRICTWPGTYFRRGVSNFCRPVAGALHAAGWSLTKVLQRSALRVSIGPRPSDKSDILHGSTMRRAR